MQDFATVGHLYRGIANGLSHLVDRFGERAVFVGAARAQTRPELLHWPQLVAVTDLESAHAALEEIIDQGEGARGDWQAAHYGRFLDMWSEYRELKAADPSFEPARPVRAAFVRQPYDIDAPQTLVTDPAARAVAELFNLAYEAVLQTLTRLFTHTDESDTQLQALAGSAIRLMSGVLRPLGPSLTAMPVGDAHPGRTTGPSFEMYYPMGNFVPWRDSAWAVLTERVSMLAERCEATARRGDVPDTIDSRRRDRPDDRHRSRHPRPRRAPRRGHRSSGILIEACRVLDPLSGVHERRTRSDSHVPATAGGDFTTG